MNKLRSHKFSDLYEISSGISSSPDQAGHGFPFVSFSTVFNNYFLTDTVPDLMDTSVEERRKYSVKEGDIFLTRTSETIDELGISCVATKDIPNATYSGFLKRLRSTQKNITYHKFMAFYLRSKFFRKIMKNNAVMTLRSSFNKQIFSYLDLLLPNYEDQKKIGDFLFQINKKIELNNKINAELEAMAKLIYDYWFLQFDFPDENGSPYKSSGGKMVYNGELKRQIPEGWQVFSISRLLDIKTGREDANHASADGKYPFFTCGEEILRCDDYAFEGKSVLLAGNGTFSVKRFNGRFNAYQRTYVLMPYKENYYAHIFYALNERTRRLTQGSRGSIVKFITKGDIEDIVLALPSQDSKYSTEVFTNVFNQIDFLIEENNKLTELRDWLLPMLMNGQVTVK
jgi:type I restriction enzyme, S subunit